ncbi:MAG TPA: hypothetical protein VGQ81_06025 [Acidobacteriota bacterium]|nr:hypothetical protein [Acidobacteriota bacterium]
MTPPHGQKRRVRPKKNKFLIGCLALLALLLASWGTLHYRFWKLNQGIDELAQSADTAAGWLDLKGAIHVHTAAGGHSRGTLDDVVEAARRTKVDFVIVTEHPRTHGYVASYQTQPDERPILIFGEEREEQSGRALVVPFVSRKEELRVATHWMSLPAETVAEIINLHEEADSVSRWKSGFFLLGSLPGYSRYFLFPVQRVFRDKLEQWDNILKQRQVSVVGGNDAHANVGLRLEYSSGHALMDWTIDPYAASFAYLSTHVLLPGSTTIDPDAILAAISQGSSYVSFDFLHDPKGFTLVAGTAWTRRAPVGTELRVVSPVACRIRVYHDGKKFREIGPAREMQFFAAEPGAYRAELYLPQLGGWAEQNPWIISNPIFIVKR